MRYISAMKGGEKMDVEILNPYAQLQLRFVDSVVDGRERLMNRSITDMTQLPFRQDK